MGGCGPHPVRPDSGLLNASCTVGLGKTGLPSSLPGGDTSVVHPWLLTGSDAKQGTHSFSSKFRITVPGDGTVCFCFLFFFCASCFYDGNVTPSPTRQDLVLL